MSGWGEGAWGAGPYGGDYRPGEFGKRARTAPVKLLDVQPVSGIVYYWSDWAGVFPSRIGGTNPAYAAYLKSAGPFRLTRSLRADAGDIVVQNLSGNTIDRDVLSAMEAGEFEGALAVLRLWDLELEAAIFEFHGALTDQSGDEREMRFQLKQIFDPSLVDMPLETFNSNCSWIFKTPPCGSVGSAVTCPKTMTACKDASRNAFHRFNGVPSVPALTQLSKDLVKKAPRPPRWDNRRPWV